MYIYSLSLLLLAIFGYPASPQIEVVKLEEGVYLYRSFAEYEGSMVSANGLIVESSDEVALIDSPWDEEQTIQLLEWIDQELNKHISFAVITHAHMDRIGGIDILKSRDIPTISGQLTAKEATQNGYTRPDFTFKSDTLLTYGDSNLEMYYPGPGHTVDNTVIYLNDKNILYGGCFIKNASAPSLGNTEDASVTDWPNSLRKVKERYPDRRMVIPGHGSWELGAIENTLNLLSKNG